MKKKQLLSGVMALFVICFTLCMRRQQDSRRHLRSAASPAEQRPVILFQKEHQYQAAALCMA